MPKESKSIAEKSPTTPAPLTSLAEIQKLCAQVKRVEFDLDGRKCALEVRRLTPAEEARVSEIVDAVIPTVIKGRLPEEDRLDTAHPDYQKRKAEAILKARAQALYWTVPAFHADKPGLKNLDEILAYVQGQLTEPLLDVLWKSCRDSGIGQAELVNFS